MSRIDKEVSAYEDFDRWTGETFFIYIMEEARNAVIFPRLDLFMAEEKR